MTRASCDLGIGGVELDRLGTQARVRSYWRFHRDEFLRLVPPPGKLTLDVGCGEGRLSRDLAALGHRVIGVDPAPTMLAGGTFVVAVVHPVNSATLPRDEATDRFRIRTHRAAHPYSDSIDREALQMTFRSFHYSFEDYWRAIRGAGFVVDELREVYDKAHALWRELPLFLHLRALKPA